MNDSAGDKLDHLLILTVILLTLVNFNILLKFSLVKPVSNTAVLSDSTGGSGSTGTGSGMSPTPYSNLTPTAYNTSGSGGTILSPTISDHSPTPYQTFSTSGETLRYSPTPTSFRTSDSGSNTLITPTAATTSQTAQSTDRFASVDSSTLSCLKSRLTSTEFETLRYFVPTNSTQEEELKLLYEKAQVCFGNFQETQNIQKATSFIGELPDSQEDCLKKALGESEFNEIKSGLRIPTSDEKLKGEACFPKETNTIKLQTEKETLSDDINKCLILALGTKRFGQIKKGNDLPTLGERDKSQRCFGVSSNPLKPRTKFSVPEEIKSCVTGKISSERLQELSAGRSEPEANEKEEVKSCFSELNSVQSKILPAPPEQVPFMTEKDEEIKVDSAFTESVKISDNLTDTHRVLTGKGPKNTVVDIYIFSDPIVVTTQTDENGDFSYKLSEPMTEGSHIAYAAFRQKNGSSVRSAVYNFEVQAAQNASPSTLLQEKEVGSRAVSKFSTYGIILIGSAILVVIIGTIYLFGFKKQSESGTEGKGESEGGTGTVN